MASQYDQINTINKNNTYKDKKKHKLDKIPTVDPPTKDSREKATKQKPICYKYIYIYIYIKVVIASEIDGELKKKKRRRSIYLFFFKFILLLNHFYGYF